MMAVFSLLLQFYLNRQAATAKILQQNQERQEAFAMALLAKEGKNQPVQTFDKGKVISSQKKGQQIFQVRTESGTTYVYNFTLNQELKSDSSMKSTQTDSQKE